MPLVLLAVSVTAGMPWRAGVGGVALVEDHDADGTGGGGVLGLQLEGARATLEQGDVPGREAGEVVGLTAAGRGVAQTELQVDSSDRGRHVTGIRLIDHVEVDALDVGDLFGRRLLEGRRTDHREREVVERLDDRVVARGLEPVDHVVDGRVVAGQAGEAIAAVGVGDRPGTPAGAPAPLPASRTPGASRWCCCCGSRRRAGLPPPGRSEPGQAPLLPVHQPSNASVSPWHKPP